MTTEQNDENTKNLINVYDEFGKAQIIEGIILETDGDMIFVEQDGGKAEWWGLYLE